MYPNPDWRNGQGMMIENVDNKAFLEALESGQLGYHEAIHFARSPMIPRTLITSLNPAITIYARNPDEDG